MGAGRQPDFLGLSAPLSRRPDTRGGGQAVRTRGPSLWLRQLFPQGQGQEARARSRPASPWDGAAGPGSPSPRLPPHCAQRVAFSPDHARRHPAPASCEDCVRKLRARAPKCPGPRPPVGRDALLQRRARSWGWAWGVRWRSSAPPHTAPQTSSLLRAEMTPGAGLSAACRDQSGEARPRASPSARPRPK